MLEQWLQVGQVQNSRRCVLVAFGLRGGECVKVDRYAFGATGTSAAGKLKYCVIELSFSPKMAVMRRDMRCGTDQPLADSRNSRCSSVTSSQSEMIAASASLKPASTNVFLSASLVTDSFA